jgi:hypothetical protein
MRNIFVLKLKGRDHFEGLYSDGEKIFKRVCAGGRGLNFV